MSTSTPNESDDQWLRKILDRMFPEEKNKDDKNSDDTDDTDDNRGEDEDNGDQPILV